MIIHKLSSEKDFKNYQILDMSNYVYRKLRRRKDEHFCLVSDPGYDRDGNISVWGTGRTMVELFSAEMLVRVCR